MKLSRVLKDDENPCTICNKSDNSMVSTENGREKKDDVFTRTCDLHDVSSVSDVDLLCHDNCIFGYLLKYKRKLQSDGQSTPQVPKKVAMFSSIAESIKIWTR